MKFAFTVILVHLLTTKVIKLQKSLTFFDRTDTLSVTEINALEKYVGRL